jgi:hypothetical protein
LSDRTHLSLWIYADNPNFAFQGAQPVLVLNGPGGSFRYEPQQDVMPNHAWSYHQIPLAGSSPWQRTVTGTPSLGHIDQLEFHHDTWGAGFTLYFDGVEFMTLSPPRLAHARVDASGKMAFELIGIVDRQYRIEVADELPNWQPLNTLTSTNLLTPFIEDAPASNAHRFYRAIEQ